MNGIQLKLMNVIANALFDAKNKIESNDAECEEVLKEASEQAVLPTAFSQIKDILSPQQKAVWQKRYDKQICKGIAIEYLHTELQRVLSENGIPAVFLKGCASGYYYPEPALRCYGDVDVLVHHSNFETVCKILTEKGFLPCEKDDGLVKHIAYRSKSGEICEVHRAAFNTPKTAEGELLNQKFNELIDTAVEITLQNGVIRIPDTFHHGLVILTHTALHLTAEGVGLRHLCDWAVFVNRTNDFENVFSEFLKECGLWNFACALTRICELYLGLPKQSWTGTQDDNLLSSLTEDILSGGNFGRKIENRDAQIKYIRNFEQNSIGGNALTLAFKNLHSRAKARNHGIFSEIFRYLKLVKTGKRKLDGKKIIDSANKRNRLYKELNLFKKEK